jgi:hypothetical protein
VLDSVSPGHHPANQSASLAPLWPRRLSLSVRATTEAAWHRRARRARQRARAIVAVAQARQLLASHHGGGGGDQASDGLPMARGRWSKDADGWSSWRGRSTSRGRGRTNNDRTAERLLEENKKLQQQLRDARRGAPPAKDEEVRHPTAREGPSRHGDWECVGCGFRTNRYAREKCYRCAAVKAHSFPQVRVVAAAAPPMVDFSSPQFGGTAISISSSLPSPSPSSPPSSISPTTSTFASSTGTSIGDGTGAANQQQPTTVSASAAQATSGAVSPASPALVGPEAIKALKGQLERLTAAKTSTATDPLLSHVTAGLEQQIQAVRNQLAAAQPLEVALRGTLSAVSAARQVLTKAEQKAAKLEAQVVSAVAAFDAASAEVQSAQRALAEAEAATARTAGGRFDPKLLIGSHPGAALAVLSEAAAARCVVGWGGVDNNLAGQVQAAFEEVQRVCRLLPADVPPPKQAVAPTAGGDTASTGTEVGIAAAPGVPGEATRGGNSGQPHGSALPAAPPSMPPASTAAAATPPSSEVATDPQQQQHQLQLQHQHQLQQQVLARQQAAELLHHQQTQAAELARQHAQALLQQASSQTAQACNPPQGPPSQPGAGAASAQLESTGAGAAEDKGQLEMVIAASVPVAPCGDGDLDGGGKPTAPQPGAIVEVRPRDDDMGGAAPPVIVNKRTAAEAVESARNIAAKAKARA